MKKAIGAIAIGVLALGVQTAAAERAPTRAERGEIAELAAPHPERCIRIDISTVDPTWGIYYSRGLQSCPGANGYVVVQKVDGFWEYVTSNGGTDGGPCAAVAPVPPRVGDDLGICKLPSDCGTLRVDGVDLPVRIVQGNVSCRTARKVVRSYFPVHGRGDQTPVVARRRWFCANSHGAELERGGVAHCASSWIRIMVRQPGKG